MTAIQNVSALGTTSLVNSSDLLPVVQGSSGPNTGTMRAVTLAQIRGGAVVSAKDFGATGDGITNDTAALNAAAVAAKNAGVPLYIPPGTYIITQIDWPSGLVGIYGAGIGVTTLKRIASDAAVHYLISSFSRSQIENLTLDGNAANNTQPGAGAVLQTDQAVVRNVEVMNTRSSGHPGGSYGWGIYWLASCSLATPTVSIIEDCYVHDIDQQGINVTGNVYHADVVGNRIKNCYSGISLGPTPSNNTGDVKFVTIANNVVGFSGQDGIGINGFNDHVTQPIQYVSVTGNVCHDCGNYGITFQADFSTLTGNTVTACGLTSNNGGVVANASRSEISGNNFSNNQGWGIDCGGAKYLNITGNFFGGNVFNTGDGCGIDCNGNVGTVIAGNTFYMNGGGFGSELSIQSFDGGGVWPVFDTVGQDVTVVGNKFFCTAGAFGVLCSGGMTGVVIQDNVFTGGSDSHNINAGFASGAIRNNRRSDEIQGPSVAAAASLVIPDWSDTVLLTGTGASISLIQGYAQQQNAGKITYIALGTAGSYTVAPTVTITGDGTGAAATVLLKGPTSGASGIGAYPISIQGGAYTTATATVSGGTGSGGVAGAVQIGYPNSVDGRVITLINASGNTQTLVNGTMIKLAGGVNCALTNNSSISFRIANSGVWYEVSRAIQ